MTRVPGQQPFEIAVPTAVIDDLHQRLDATRWPGEIGGVGWEQGTPEEFLHDLCAYWRAGYDWRVHEARLNEWPQVLVEVDGVQVHAIVVAGRGTSTVPLCLTHGWPSSVVEFAEVIDALADPAAHGGSPADAFDVVVPSLPGFGFSGIPEHPGMSPRRIAQLWIGLMEQLGYTRFGAHGGDWGSYVSALAAYDRPDRVLGAHLTMVPLRSAARPRRVAGDPDPDRARRRARWIARESGYSHLQETKPQSLAYGLTDSPAGLAGWIVEKWRAWSDCDGDVERCFTKDQLLTNISVYWFTRTIASSMRLYWESYRDDIRVPPGGRVEVPCGFAAFAREALPDREHVEALFNVTHWTEFSRGGHFPALEQPAALVDDLRAFFRPLRSPP